MPKTYGTVTTFTAGSVLTAAQLNTAGTAINNLVVPPSVQVTRTTNLTSYTNDTPITWSSKTYDTDSMYSSGSNLTVATPGLYIINFVASIQCVATLSYAIPAIVISGNATYGAGGWILNAGVFAYLTHTLIVPLVASDTIAARVGFSGGSGHYIASGASMTATWIGRTS